MRTTENFYEFAQFRLLPNERLLLAGNEAIQLAPNVRPFGIENFSVVDLSPIIEKVNA